MRSACGPSLLTTKPDSRLVLAIGALLGGLVAWIAYYLLESSLGGPPEAALDRIEKQPFALGSQLQSFDGCVIEPAVAGGQ